MDDKRYETLFCALSDNNHFVKVPIVLPDCGHSVCRDCLPIEVNKKSKCKKCDKAIKRDLKYDKESLAIGQWLESSLDNLLNIIKEQTNKKISKFKSSILSLEENINLEVNFLEEEIEIRIESMKIELDILHDKFKKELNDIRKYILKYQRNEIKDAKNDLNYFESEFNALSETISEKNNQNKELLYMCQSKLIYLNHLVDNFEKRKYDLKFNPSNSEMNESLIGDINFKHKLNTKSSLEIVQKLKSDNYKEFNTSFIPIDVCQLINNNYVIAGVKALRVYDSNDKCIKVVDKINGKSFELNGIAVNNKNQIYISDIINSRVILIDDKFEKVKSYGKNRFRCNGFRVPGEMVWCKNDNLYVCDEFNCRLVVLSTNLEFRSIIPLELKPRHIKISNTTVFISGTHINDKWKVNIYMLKNWDLISSSNTVYCRFCKMDFYFFSLDHEGTIICYNSDGSLIERDFINKSIIEKICNNKVGIFTVNDKLLLFSYKKNTYLEFRF